MVSPWFPKNLPAPHGFPMVSPWFPPGLPFQHPALGQRAQAEAAADRRRPGGPEEVPVHRDLRVGHGTAAAAGDHRHLDARPSFGLLLAGR